jgi:hypothetical protein
MSSRYRRRYDDPTGTRYGLPTFPWRTAPDGLATRRQLAAAGLRPGRQPIAAQVMWRGRGCDRVAYLYRVELARPKRAATVRQLAALNRAMTARRTCPDCGQDRGYVLPARYGCCVPCADRWGVAA